MSSERALTGYVYVLTNTVNGKQYVGQTTQSITRRWKQHCHEALLRGRGCRVLKDAIRKYGPGAFELHSMKIDPVTQDALDATERRLIEIFGTLVPHGYNLTTGGDGGGQRFHHESRARISASLTGRKFSPETIERLRVAHRGQVRTPETRAKISASMKGLRRTPEHQRNLDAARRGKPASARQREAIRKSWLTRSREVSDETREKLRQASNGRVYSETTREKLRASKQAWWDARKASVS